MNDMSGDDNVTQGSGVIMKFGKFKGKPVEEVPDSYLYFLYHNRVGGVFQSDLALYLEDNIDAITKNHLHDAH